MIFKFSVRSVLHKKAFFLNSAVMTELPKMGSFRIASFFFFWETDLHEKL